MLILYGTAAPDIRGMGLTWSPPLDTLVNPVDPTLSSPYVVPNTIIHIATLDPSIQHNLTINYAFTYGTNVVNRKASLHNFVTYSSYLLVVTCDLVDKLGPSRNRLP